MCSYDCSTHPTDINEDNDITGIGVLIGYCATAGIAVSIIVLHYLCSFEPRVDPFKGDQADPSPCMQPRPNPIDEIMLRGPRELFAKTFGTILREKRSRVLLEQSLIKCILSMSDIQIITGISVLISGATQLKCGISTYQWQVLVYLAWFSSLTHLSCLTLLRKHLYHRPAERAWRLICMFILVVLLILAFLPTVNYRWQHVYSITDAGRPAPQDYAICYLKPVRHRDKGWEQLPYAMQTSSSYSDHAIVAMSVSIVLIFVGFVSRVLKLHRNLSTFLTQSIRGRTSDILRKPLRVVEAWCSAPGLFQNLKRLYLYRPLLALFLTARISLDTWNSMFFEVWWLIISFIWGVERLFSVVTFLPSKENSQWSFGQVMAIALLAVPLVTVFELIYPETKSQAGRRLQSRNYAPSDNIDEGIFGPQDIINEPSLIISRATTHQPGIDHPDYELFYESGSLTAPALALFCSIVVLSLWCLVNASMFNGLQDIGFLDFSFYPWGVLPLLLIFYVFTSILFSSLVPMITKGSRQRSARPWVVHLLLTFIVLSLTAATFMMYGSVGSNDRTTLIAIAVFAFYFLCSFAVSFRNSKATPRIEWMEHQVAA